MALRNKYKRQKKQYSTDSGLTWTDVYPAEYRRGELLEVASEDCNTTEWREKTGSWFCIGFSDKQYRWVDTGEYECAVGDKYVLEAEELSEDDGSTWTRTGNTRYASPIRNSSDCPIDYNTESLTIEITSTGGYEFGTLYSNLKSLEYKIDNGQWTPYSEGIEVTNGQKIQWRGNLSSNSSTRVFSASNDVRYDVWGNINSIYDYDTLTTNCYDYQYFFGSDYWVVNADRLVLPATTMAQTSYKCMFNLATSLLTPPVLPATTLANDCYSQMFKGAHSLLYAPQLPAMTVPYGAYYEMFGNCRSLVNPPALPATTIGEGAYMRCFMGCTSLTSMPDLPAMTVPTDGYNSMFASCTSLTEAKELPATTLGNYAYKLMFGGDINLVSAPTILPCMTLWPYVYFNMFYQCTSLQRAPELPATTFVNSEVTDGATPGYALYAYYTMFDGCSSLNYIKMLIADFPDEYDMNLFTDDWVRGVASTGTFVQNAGANWEVIGRNGIPEGWTIQYDGSRTRWVDSGQYLCDGSDKYVLEKEQTTLDGTTWTDTGETRKGSLIEASSEDCMYSSSYLTITSLQDGNNIYWRNGNSTTSGTIRTIEISTDGGTTWTSKSSQRNDISIATLDEGETLLVRGTAEKYYISAANFFKSDYNVNLSGNIMSMRYGEDFAGQTTITSSNAFRGLFRNLKVVSAENLVLPSLTLTDYCYANMFSGVTTLVTPPSLPATTLAMGCYNAMFSSCRSMTTAPELNAATLADYCYNEMFSGASSLSYIKMTATNLGNYSLTNWTNGVSSTGTFVKNSSTTIETGTSGIPSGWTVVTE